MPYYSKTRTSWFKRRAQFVYRLKKIFYCNPLFKLLLYFDIDTFIKGEPVAHSLTQKEECLLFERRLALNNYFQTLRLYSLMKDRLPNGIKGQANQSYSHQFKGTLPTTRRLFDIAQDFKRNPRGRTVLKYDKLLFKPVVQTQKNYNYKLKKGRY